MGQLFSKKNKEVFSTPLGLNNPVTVQVLGICSALAVTAKLEPAIVMGLSVTVITAFSNVVISLLRKTIPNRIRIIVQLVVVAALVTIVSEIKAQFKSADTFKAKTVITLGESEVESGVVKVKNNATREEVTVSFEELTTNFATVLKQLEK